MTPPVVEFFRSATLGRLRVGISASDIERHLGTAFSRTTYEVDTEVWKYGPLQLTILEGKLHRLKLDCLDESRLPHVLQNVVVPSAKTTVYSLIDMLEEHDIDWQIDPAHSFERQLCLLTASGVRAYFDLDHCELQSLQA